MTDYLNIISDEIKQHSSILYIVHSIQAIAERFGDY